MFRRLVWLTMLGLGLAGCASGADQAMTEPEPVEVTVDEDADGQPFSAASGTRAATDEVEAEAPADADVADAPEDEAPGEGIGSGVSVSDLPETAAGDKVIKEGSVSIEVETGTFDAAYAQVVDVAARLGGNVAGSTTTTADDGATSGTITVRVPVERYEQLLVGVADVGEIRSRDITAQDVTAEYTDLESRLRHLQAQERFYLELLERADSVNDLIAVRQQLDGLQADIEQIKGRLQVLDARTTFSLLTVELFEPGAPLDAIGPPPPPGGPSLAEWWASAQDALVNVVGVMLVVAFFLAPLSLPAALVYLFWRAVRQRPAVTPPGEPGAPAVG